MARRTGGGSRAVGARAAEAAPGRAPELARAGSHGSWIVLALILLAAAVRWRLLDAPLERDEGEYAYAGQQILQGVPPYASLYNMKWPGIYAAYAGVLALFGETASGIHLALLLVNAATTWLLWRLARRLAGDLAGVAAAATFALLSIGQTIGGVYANAEHFVLLPAVGGLLVLVAASGSGRPLALAAAGALLGLAALIKQHGAVFLAFGALWLAIELWRAPQRARLPRFLAFAGGAALPFLAAALWLLAAGVLDAFWLWTVRYAPAYVSQIPLAKAHASFAANAGLLVQDAPGALGVAALSAPWALTVLGLAALVLDRSTKGVRAFAALFFAFSFLAVCPGFFFRPHYFLLLLPAAALAAGLAVRAIASRAGARAVPAAAAVLLVALGPSVLVQQDYLFELSPEEVTRTTFPYNPFAESVAVARIVAAETRPDDRVLVLGSEPQICFYAKRRSATGFAYMYPLTEIQPLAGEMQRAMIREAEASDPKIVVAVEVPGSWLKRPRSHGELFAWIAKLPERYETIARVPVRIDGLPMSEQVRALPAEAQPRIDVLRRRE